MIWAADANAQLSVGAGYNLGTTTLSLQGDSESDELNGFYLEAVYDWDFLDAGWGMLGIQPGVRFSYMGESDVEEEGGLRAVASLNETYLDIPVNVRYSYFLGSVRLSAFVGPVFSLGLSSAFKTKLSGSLIGQDVDYMVKYHNYTGTTVTKGEGSSSADVAGYPDYGRFDIKLGLGVGATFMERFNVKLGYNFGLLNRYKGEQVEGYGKVKMHTGVFYIGLGYNF